MVSDFVPLYSASEFAQKTLVGLGDSSIGKVLALQVRGIGVEPWNPWYFVC